MNTTIQRITKDPVIPTFGILLRASGIPFALTLERPWLDNKKGVSCIPARSYLCQRIVSPKFGETFQVVNVPDRDEILFHKGNINEDSHGCIIIGEEFNEIFGEDGITASEKGFREFMKQQDGENTFYLTIKDPK